MHANSALKGPSCSSSAAHVSVAARLVSLQMSTHGLGFFPFCATGLADSHRQCCKLTVYWCRVAGLAKELGQR